MEQTLMGLVLVWAVVNFVVTIVAYLFRQRDPALKGFRLKEDKANLKILSVNLARELGEKVLGYSFLGLGLSFSKSISENFWSWTWFNFLLCFLLVDFSYYMAHLINHKVQLFWNQHSVHHNSPAYTLTTGYRVSWIKFLFQWIFYLPLGFFGFPPTMIILSLLLINSYAHLLHTEKVKEVPWLEYILNTPKAHRIHHSSFETHIDKNMGGVFMFWDWMFGTFTLKAADQVRFGLTQPLESDTVPHINFSEWSRLYKYYKAKGLKKVLCALFRNPNKNKELLA